MRAAKFPDAMHVLKYLHNLSLRIGIHVDVVLRGAQVGVPRKLLNVSDRAAHGRYFPSSVGNECSTSAVA